MIDIALATDTAAPQFLLLNNTDEAYPITLIGGVCSNRPVMVGDHRKHFIFESEFRRTRAGLQHSHHPRSLSDSDETSEEERCTSLDNVQEMIYSFLMQVVHEKVPRRSPKSVGRTIRAPESELSTRSI